jgi:hypothetical protein
VKTQALELLKAEQPRAKQGAKTSAGKQGNKNREQGEGPCFAIIMQCRYAVLAAAVKK